MYGPVNAVALLSSRSRQDGIHEIRWALADGSKVTTYEYSAFERFQEGADMTAGPTLLQRTWYMLDSEVDLIFDPTPETDAAKHRVRARAIAEVLAMFMVPHFNTADEISAEAKKRYEARQSGNSTYETAGLGMRKYEPPPTSPSKYEEPKKAVKKTSAPKKSGKTIPAEALDNVKKALEMKMFTVPMVAKTYGMTETEVKTQLGLP